MSGHQRVVLAELVANTRVLGVVQEHVMEGVKARVLGVVQEHVMEDVKARVHGVVVKTARKAADDSFRERLADIHR